MRDAEGNPVEGARLVAYPEPYNYASVASAQTAADGYFSIPDLPAGSYTIRLETDTLDAKRSLAPHRFPRIQAGSTHCAFVAPPAAPITGRVLSPEGEAVADCYVYCSERDITDWPDDASRTDQYGSFTLVLREDAVVDISAILERPTAPLDSTKRYHAIVNRVAAGSTGIELRISPK